MITDEQWAAFEERLGMKFYPHQRRLYEQAVEREWQMREHLHKPRTEGPHLHFDMGSFGRRGGRSIFADVAAKMANYPQADHLTPKSQNSDGSYTITDLPRHDG